MICRIKADRVRTSYAELVDRYIAEFRERAAREMRFYAIQSSIEKAVEKATLCLLPSGKRHDHQHRIPGARLREALSILNTIDFAVFDDFEDLHSAIEHALAPTPGIGKLTIYDIAHRIGAKLILEPKSVYLHSGTKDGARLMGIGGDTVDLDELSKIDPAFGRLTPAELEDLLCIYKNDIARIVRSS
jgi:hypothetical protein